MKTIPSAMLIIGCFLLLSEAISGRFSNQCTNLPRLPQNSKTGQRLKLSVGTDYNQLQTDASSQFYDGSIHDYFKYKPVEKFLGMKYFKIQHTDMKKFLNIQYGHGVGRWNVPGYLAYDFEGEDAIFTLHQNVSKDADTEYYVRCVSQCNGWEGYYLSYSNTEMTARGYVWMSSKPAAFIVQIVEDNALLSFKGQNQWYCKDKWVQTSNKEQGANFTLVEIKGAKLPKTFLALNDKGYMYTTNNEREASEFVTRDGALKCVANCHVYGEYTIGPYGKYAAAIWGDHNTNNQLRMDDYGRISFAEDQFWYFVASYGGWNDANDYLATDSAFGQQFCVEQVDL